MRVVLAATGGDVQDAEATARPPIPSFSLHPNGHQQAPDPLPIGNPQSRRISATAALVSQSDLVSSSTEKTSIHLPVSIIAGQETINTSGAQQLSPSLGNHPVFCPDSAAELQRRAYLLALSEISPSLPFFYDLDIHTQIWAPPCHAYGTCFGLRRKSGFSSWVSYVQYWEDWRRGFRS